ncbi:Sec8 exocyst complex component-specific domain-domain-containing protein [Naematelia encephala]|uniref:Exocyst complex component Sec8 n=1 Tax=Naematelia encephala TaxID=71784 RepID=A0A1Y2AYX1_9TREE|nr:Sec8 exocyst complex component-specific domain-domain-containing protein [Naematelia encephala]
MMSRAQPSTARYKISNPQPLAQVGSQNGSSSPIDPPPQSAYQPPPRPGQAAGRYNGESSRQPTPSASPMRPARSRLRDPPAVPTVSSSRRDLLPLQTQNIRRPSQSSLQGGDKLVSPISPASPVESTGAFLDPFAAQRNERAELRAQVTTAAQQAALPHSDGSNNDKLRNVVGAFMAASRREEPAIRRPGKSEARQRAKHTPKEEIWEVGPEGGGKFAELDGVVKKIRKDWPFVMDSDFSPSTLALSLLSQNASSSLPAHPSLSSFMRLHDALSSSLQSAVQAHFQSFAASLPAHATFIATLSRAQQQVRNSQKALREARDGFAGKGKSELSGVRARERQVRDMLRILDTIDNLKQVPDQLEGLIGDKRFLQAALILVSSLKTASKGEITEIGAMSELKQYLTAQETTLYEILVEELHNHLYLKTIYSDSRWRSHAPGQQSLPIIEPTNSENRLSRDVPSGTPTTANGEASLTFMGSSSQFSRYLSALTVKPNREPMLDFLDTTSPKPTMSQAPSNASLSGLATSVHTAEPSNPESESYSYMETLLEALATLGRLGPALENVIQRVSTEIHALVESTLDEVEERSEQRREEAKAGAAGALSRGEYAPLGDQDTYRTSLFAPPETIQLAVSLDVFGPPQHAAILRDLFWTLYSKLAAVLEGHRAVYEIARWISSRRDFKDVSSKISFNVPVVEIWKPIQQEVRMLLNSYLTDDSQDALERHALMSINEILRQGKIARDRQRALFKFADTDNRAVASEMKTVDDSLQHALKSSVPGLVGMQAVGDSGQSVLNGRLANTEDTVAKHRTLIPPNAFNVTTLFQPTLSFIERAVSIVPPGFEDETEAFGSVLEDFVVKVFLPQLDERVTASFQQAVSGYDAYQVDRRLTESVVKPPLKSSVRVMALIHSLCLMLETTPFHRENYSRLIIGVIVQYYQQCSTRFKELASLPIIDANTTEPPLALPGVWAQREDIIEMLTELRAVAAVDRPEIALISQKEVKIEMELLGDKPIVESQLINSYRKIEALGHLSQSLRWFIDSLLDLQSISDGPVSSASAQASSNVEDSLLAHGPDEPRLALTQAMAQRFEAIIQTYEQLAEMVLNTIRLEARCRVICNLGASLRKGDFRLESEALEPDPDVVDLNVSLVETEAVASLTLSEEDRLFILRGLGHLVDHLFITSARSIKMVNLAGVQKIKRNILSLQQTLRGLSRGHDDGVLTRSMAYWDMYERGPKNMLETIRTTKPMFSFEDYNTMLNLQCKVDQSEAPSSELNTYLIDLHALSMSIEGWEIDETV